MKQFYSNSVQVFLLLLIPLFISSCNPEHSKKPNIILIMADDMGFECLSCYGSQSYSTPILDKMAANGIKVENCISNPLCTPSRVKIMTGKRNFRNYEYFGYLNPDQYTFGNLFKEAGYKTCIAGKWQLNGIYHDLPGNQDLSRPFGFGFDEYCLWQVNKNKGEGERFANPLILQNGEELPRNPDAYGPDIFSDYVCDFIERNRENHFFVYYPMVLVHDPFVPTPDSQAWSDPGRRYEKDTTYFKDMVAYTDKIVGKILKKLEVEGIAENTLVIFTGDNGTNRAIVSQIPGRKIRGGKGNTIDAGVHVPLIIKWPAEIKEPFVSESTIDFTDFFDTFSQILGYNRENDGESFLGMLTGKKYVPRDYAFVYYDPMWGKAVNANRNMFVQDNTYKLYQDGNMFAIREDYDEKHPLPVKANKEMSDKELSSTLKRRKEMQKFLNTGPEWKKGEE